MRMPLFAVPMLGLVVAAAVLSPQLPAQTLKAELRGAEQTARQAQAAEAFRAGRYASAYARFAALADAGDAPSAQGALVINAVRGRLDIEDSERGD